MRTRVCSWTLSWLATLQRPRRSLLVFAAAFWLVTPTLFSGFAFDDYLFIYQTDHPAHDEWAGSAPFDLFRWIDVGHRARLIDGQGLPWWTFEQASVAFMRPLSSLTHEIDHWLWPTGAFGMHLHSILWFACMLFLAARTYSELCESRFVAAVASAMFAIDSAHGASVGWISNRNALLGGVFGIATLFFHQRQRSGRGRRFALLAWACFALGLGSTEAGIASAGYLLSYALWLERSSLRARCASLFPYALIAGGWAFIRHAAHYGVVGLGGYVDPFKAPLAFLALLPKRVLVLLSGQVARLCADLFDSGPSALQPLLLFAAATSCALVLWTAWPVLRSDRQARFWACAALFSALPLTAAVPSDRLLTPVGLAVMGFLAHVMRDVFQSERSPARALGAWVSAARRDVALGLVFIHFVIDPLLLPWVALLPAGLSHTTQVLDASLTDSPALRHQTVIVAAIPDSWMLSYLPVMRSLNGKPRPDKLHWLLTTQDQAQFERLSDTALRVHADQGFFDSRWFERNSLQPMHVGDRFALSEMTITVLEVTRDGRPLVCDFVFSQPLESSKYLWLTFRDGRLEPFQLPAAGKRTSLHTS